MRLTKNVKNILTITVLAVLLYAANYFLVGKTFIPQNFIDAHASASKTAAELMTMFNDAQAKLDQISQYQQSNNFPKALELVNQELGDVHKSYEKSQTLLTELADMSNAANGITPIKARNLAVEAMNQEFKLMTKLIDYNKSFNSLLENLQLKVSVAGINNSSEIKIQIENMNSAGKEINDLNALFNQKMDEFNKMTK